MPDFNRWLGWDCQLFWWVEPWSKSIYRIDATVRLSFSNIISSLSVNSRCPSYALKEYASALRSCSWLLNFSAIFADKVSIFTGLSQTLFSPNNITIFSSSRFYPPTAKVFLFYSITLWSCCLTYSNFLYENRINSCSTKLITR